MAGERYFEFGFANNRAILLMFYVGLLSFLSYAEYAVGPS